MTRRTRMPETIPDSGWQQEAECRSVDPELFFPISERGQSTAQILEAKAVCWRCPVQPECLQYAFDENVEDGIWGGLTEGERRERLRRQSRRTAA
jgi:WhiB family redox-sensing transcriptional regulator